VQRLRAEEAGCIQKHRGMKELHKATHSLTCRGTLSRMSGSLKQGRRRKMTAKCFWQDDSGCSEETVRVRDNRETRKNTYVTLVDDNQD